MMQKNEGGGWCHPPLGSQRVNKLTRPRASDLSSPHISSAC